MNADEVARRAKVSIATVSRVLNGTAVVKSATHARVVKAIEGLNYNPKPVRWRAEDPEHWTHRFKP